jgi:hypothetical protein
MSASRTRGGAPKSRTLLREVRALLRPYRDAAGPFPGGDDWQAALHGRFEPFTRIETEHVHRLTVDDYVALVGSWSWIANLDPAERRPLLDRVRGLAGDRDRVEIRYRVEAYLTRPLVE